MQVLYIFSIYVKTDAQNETVPEPPPPPSPALHTPLCREEARGRKADASWMEAELSRTAVSNAA